MSIELLLCLGLTSISDIKEKRIPNSLIVSLFLIGIADGRVSSVESIIGVFVLPLVLMLILNSCQS